MLTTFRKENKAIFYFTEYKIGNLVTKDEVIDKAVTQVIMVTSKGWKKPGRNLVPGLQRQWGLEDTAIHALWFKPVSNIK